MTTYHKIANVRLQDNPGSGQEYRGLALWTDKNTTVPTGGDGGSILDVTGASIVSITDLTTGTTVTNSEENFEVGHKYEFVIEGIRAASHWTLKDLGTNVKPISEVEEWVAMDGARTEETADGVYTFTFNLEVLKVSPGSSSPAP